MMRCVLRIVVVVASVVCDCLRWLCMTLRSTSAVEAENLFLRRQLALYVERRRLARKAQLLGRKVLKELETLVTPDTLLRWYRELIASKWNYSHRRGPGRPRVMTVITDLIVHMALENSS